MLSITSSLLGAATETSHPQYLLYRCERPEEQIREMVRTILRYTPGLGNNQICHCNYFHVPENHKLIFLSYGSACESKDPGNWWAEVSVSTITLWDFLPETIDIQSQDENESRLVGLCMSPYSTRGSSFKPLDSRPWTRVNPLSQAHQVFFWKQWHPDHSIDTLDFPEGDGEWLQLLNILYRQACDRAKQT